MSILVLLSRPPEPDDDNDGALPFVWLVLVMFAVVVIGQLVRAAPADTGLIDEPVPHEWEGESRLPGDLDLPTIEGKDTGDGA